MVWSEWNILVSIPSPQSMFHPNQKEARLAAALLWEVRSGLIQILP